MISIEEAANKILGSAQQKPTIDQAAEQIILKSKPNNSSSVTKGSFGQNLAQVQADTESPISLLDRAKLSFADDNGKMDYLKKKFKYVEPLPTGGLAAGNTPEALAPIDPQGIENDFFGDVADLTSAIPVIAGQIAGATAGSALGPGGTIAGGGVGAGVGEGANKLIGKLLGVNAQDTKEIATDMVISSAFGAAGEGLGQALKGAGKYLIKPQITRLMDEGVATSANPSKTLQTIAKTAKITSGVDEKDVIEAGTYGFNKTLTPKYTNEKYLDEITTKFVDGVVKKDEELGQAVGAGDAWAVNKFGNKKLNLQPIGSELLEALSSPRVGLIDPVTKQINKSAFSEAADYRTVNNVIKDLFGKNPKTGEIIPKNLTFREALDVKKKASSQLKSYFNSDRVNPDAKRAITEYLSGVSDEIAGATVPEGFKIDDPRVLENNKYLRANKAFSQWKSDIDLLKQNGLNIEDIGNLEDLYRNGRVLSSKVEGFAKSLQNRTGSAQEAFKIVSEQLPTKFPGGGIGGSQGTLFDELRKFNAAQGFAKSDPNFLRLQSIATMTGLGFLIDRKTPAGAAAGLGAGLLLGTPAGMSKVLRGGENLFKFAPKALAKGANSRLPKLVGRTERAGAAILSRLIDRESSHKDASTR